MSDASVFEWRGRTGPFVLRIGPSVFRPTTTSQLLAEALEIAPGDTVLDGGSGCGVLAIVAARLGAGRVVGCDVSAAAVAEATANARALAVDDRVEFRVGHLLEPAQDVRPDVVIADVSGVPDALAARAGWFPDGKGGGPTGAELPAAFLASLPRDLGPGARLYLPTGSVQREAPILDEARRRFAVVEEVATREVPLPAALLEGSPECTRLVEEGVITLRRRGSRLWWRISIWKCSRPRE